MPILRPYIPTRAEQHANGAWMRDECYRFYVRQRRLNCNMGELIDLWLRAPCCDQCIQSDPFYQGGLPEISGGDDWAVDVLLALGPATLETVESARAEDPDFPLHCKSCYAELRPWDGDDVYILSYHLEEDYGIPMTTPGRASVPEHLCKKILELYGQMCFGCGATDRPLHTDHVLPRSAGGDAAFRNLQPLCEPCGNKKGSALPGDVAVYSDMYFGPQPRDSCEGLFW